MDDARFQSMVAAMPLVSVDLVVVRGGAEVLLGLRNNRPAQGFWFVPGGRVLKDERRADAPAGFEVQLGDDPHAALRWWPLAEAAGSGVVHPGAYRCNISMSHHTRRSQWPLQQSCL